MGDVGINVVFVFVVCMVCVDMVSRTEGTVEAIVFIEGSLLGRWWTGGVALCLTGVYHLRFYYKFICSEKIVGYTSQICCRCRLSLYQEIKKRKLFK